jgi:hypothetical protein
MLDLAHRRWPDVHDRRALLLRLVEAGADRVAQELDGGLAQERREHQREALRHAPHAIDAEVLLSDAAWR